MTFSRIKSFFTYTVVISKIVIIGTAFIHWLSGGLYIEEMKSIIQIIIPLFSLHISAIIKNGLTMKKEVDLEEISRSSAFVHIIVPLVYFFSMFTIINLRPIGIIRPENFTDLESLLVLSEIAFGAYFGQIIFNIFSRQSKRKPTNNKD